MPRGRLQFDETLRWLHRWLGLALGLPFVLVCLSGSLLLFQPQFFRWAHGDLIPENMPADIGSIDRWVASASAAVPALGEPIAIWAPGVEHNASEAAMLVFGGLEPGGLGNMGFAGVLVAPSSGDLLGVVDIDRTPAYAPLFLHRDLWAAQTGQILLGIVSLLVLPMLLMGLYLWWPRGGRLRDKLFPARLGRTLSLARPLHDWSGVWSLPLLILLTVTGLYLVRPTWVTPLLESVVPAQETAATAAAPAACLAPMNFDTAIERAGRLVPQGRLAALYPSEQGWEIVFKAGASDAMLRETHVLANMECGWVEIEATPQTRSPLETSQMWLISLHDGTAAGLPGRLLVTLAGLIPLVLLWSGVRLWMRRRGWLQTSPRPRSSVRLQLDHS